MKVTAWCKVLVKGYEKYIIINPAALVTSSKARKPIWAKICTNILYNLHCLIDQWYHVNHLFKKLTIYSSYYIEFQF